MKKQILLLAGSALILASCGSNNNSTQNQQAQMDSISKANAALQDEMNKKKNDSTINAMAAARADSIEKADHKGTVAGGHKAGHKGSEPTTPPPPPPPPPGGMKGHSDQSQNQGQTNPNQPSGGGMKSHSDQSQGH